MKNKRKIIIDTDGGSDDVIAIAMALKEKNVEVLMISCVAGNVEVKQAALNVLTVLEYTNTYFPPVYLGSKKPLKMKLECAYDTHGFDGLGDKGYKPQKLHIQKEDAIDKMIETINNEDVELITLGPLTNIALAIKKAPKVMKKLKRIVAMASNGLGYGNMSPTSEYNVYQDALACKQVIDFGFKDISLVGWDACLGKAIFTEEEINRIKNTNSLGKMLIDVNSTLIQFNKARFNYNCLDLADPAAMVYFLNPKCGKEIKEYYCDVETRSGITYGQVVIDYYNTLNKLPNCKICSKLKASSYKNYLFKLLEET